MAKILPQKKLINLDLRRCYNLYHFMSINIKWVVLSYSQYLNDETGKKVSFADRIMAAITPPSSPRKSGVTTPIRNRVTRPETAHEMLTESSSREGTPTQSPRMTQKIMKRRQNGIWYCIRNGGRDFAKSHRALCITVLSIVVIVMLALLADHLQPAESQ